MRPRREVCNETPCRFWKRLQRGNTWTIAYYAGGKRIRESVPDARSEQDARKKLNQRIAEIHSHRFIGPAEDKLLFTDLVQLIKNDYKGRASLVTLPYHLTP